jgi:hypothetical protein
MISCLAVGCSTPTVIVFPATHSLPLAAPGYQRMPQCRYSRVAISHAESSHFSAADIELNLRISLLLGDELRRRGASVMEDAAHAYWSVTVLAAEDPRFRNGFVFSATVALREFGESHAPGVTTLGPGPGDGGLPTFYTGLGFGPGHDLVSTLIRFVNNADAVMLPVAEKLCQQEGREILRDVEAELAIPLPNPL